MRGLFSQFADQLLWVAGAGLCTILVGGLVSLTADRSSRSISIWRVLAIGSAVIVVLATATGPLSSDGDLVLAPGGAGLGHLDQILDDPNSLAGVLLISNVVLYLPVGFFGSLGWVDHRRRLLAAALLLSLSIEAAQYWFLGRVASTDDVLLNLLGATIGYLAGSKVPALQRNP